MNYLIMKRRLDSELNCLMMGMKNKHLKKKEIKDSEFTEDTIKRNSCQNKLVMDSEFTDGNSGEDTLSDNEEERNSGEDNVLASDRVLFGKG